MTPRKPFVVDRRRFLTGSAGAAVVVGLTGGPALGSSPGQIRTRLSLPSGVQTGDVTTDRPDRPRAGP
ncbi:MAG: twin-arginine translocation signal domain-containing protein [Propionibacteriales bacterium]|nr:twin-arginine translocation signal domain-containing protein [Propionibacteriales bacterium]